MRCWRGCGDARLRRQSSRRPVPFRSYRPLRVPQQPLIAALPELPHTPPLDSRQPPRKTRRTANPPPIMRLWIPGEETPPPRRRTPQDHADRLLRWVRENGCSGGAVLAMDLQKIYPAMCEQLDWKPYRWQPVACELRKLTGKRKSTAGSMGIDANAPASRGSDAVVGARLRSPRAPASSRDAPFPTSALTAHSTARSITVLA